MDRLYLDFAHKIHILAHKLNIEAENALEQLDLSLTGYKFLHILNKKGSQSQEELGLMTGITPAATSKRIKNMLEKNRIKVSVDKNNRRKNIITISKEGKELLNKAEKIISQTARKSLSNAKNLESVNKELDILLEPFMRDCK